MQYKTDDLISVIITVFNTEQYFDRCITSLLRQSYDNLEIIVVNDGSKGNIRTLIQDYIRKDKRIRFVDNAENRGLFRARIEGVKVSTGQYLAFVDSDDYVSYDFYRTLYRRTVETYSDITIGKTVWDDQGERFIYNFHESAFNFSVLEEDEIKKNYFGQKLFCYSWHTVWNKLYTRQLWDRCLPIFDRVDSHIVMTEDICFSSILLYEAHRLSRVEDEAYFYCINGGASTDQSNITCERFNKNIRDIKTVFDFVDKYLDESGADKYVKSGLAEGRKHYGRMWLHLLNQCKFNKVEVNHCRERIREFAGELDLSLIGEDFFFESIKTKWNGGIEYIKEQISDRRYKYVTFDIFDTLICRPLYEPNDLFKLMSPFFDKLTNTNVSFLKIREEGERAVRERLCKNETKYQDITLTEIYNGISEIFGIPSGVCDLLREKECELEITLSTPRNTGKRLFELAVDLGKEVVLISDMYLEKATIEAILRKNRITGYKKIYLSSEARRLKYNGALFLCMLNDYGDIQNSTIHIGDSWASDIEGSKTAGITSIFLPKAKDVFENQIKGFGVNHCSDIGNTVCGDVLDYSSIKNNLGYRCMLAIAFNKYFDNPYRNFNQTTDFNADPYFIGFYALGMHITALVKWIIEKSNDKKITKIFFLARDGYLPFQAYEIFRKYFEELPEAQYLQASRRMLMPAIARTRLNFYELPIEYRAHTPMSLWRILEYASYEIDDQQFRRIMNESNISPNKAFEGYKDYCRFIDVYLNRLYDHGKQTNAVSMLKNYYSEIKESGGVTFDMGYSGRIQEAISYCCGKGVDVLFLHQDYRNSVEMRRSQSFRIDSFYDFRPGMTGLIREHILSDCAGSCIGLCMNNGKLEPLIEDERKEVIGPYVVRKLQEGAKDFVKEFLQYFSMYLPELDHSGIEASLVFEGFLRNGSLSDRKIFSESYFEDMVYGAQEKLNVMEYINREIHSLNVRNMCSQDEMVSMEERKYDWFQAVLEDKPKVVRAILMFFIDREMFIRKLKKNIPVLRNI